MKLQNDTSEIRLHGVPASPGIAFGPAICMYNAKTDHERKTIPESDVPTEILRATHAFERTQQELQKIKQSAQMRIGAAGAMIFEAQIMILLDPTLASAVAESIKQKSLDAESAVADEFAKLETPLRASQDSRMRERAGDFADLRQRVLRNLQQERTRFKFENESVIVAESLSPADAIELSNNRVLAFAIDGGGLTSHAVILARSMNIPAVIGLRTAANCTDTGAFIIVDGDAGIVIVNPTPETRKTYELKRERIRLLTERLSDIATLPSTTTDSRHIILEANLDRETDIAIARRAGAEGIGLVRTEMMLMNRNDFPNEQEQYLYYKSLAERMHPHWVTIRVFDIGADKIISAFPYDEQNPALGKRGTRLLLDNENIFITQLRAILRAAEHRNVRLLLPMITSIEEIWEAQEIIERVKSDLRRDKEPFDRHLPVGVMVEVPSAALLARGMANESDFLSIGTNDLTQYTLAVDRTNENIAHIYEEFHPAVLRLIMEIITAGHQEETTVAVCGEMAGNTLATALLAGMGIDELSVATSRLLPVKSAIRNVSMSEAERLTRTILTMRTARDVRAYLNEWRTENDAT